MTDLSTDRRYITSNIVYQNGYTYNIVNDKIQKITRKNWHNLLDELNWEKMEYGWRRRLKEKHVHNSCFAIMDSDSDGNCMFSSIAESINRNNDYSNTYTDVLTSDDIRNLTANQINQKNFRQILESYITQVECDEFDGEWDPNDIDTIDKLKNIIKTNGNKFWGDHIALQLISKKLKIKFIILKSGSKTDSDPLSRYKVYLLGETIEKNNKYIILHYKEDIHFQLVGYFNGCIMTTIFTYSDLPKILIEVFENDKNNIA